MAEVRATLAGDGKELQAHQVGPPKTGDSVIMHRLNYVASACVHECVCGRV